LMYAVWRRVPADLITSSTEPLLEPTSIGEVLKESNRV